MCVIIYKPENVSLSKADFMCAFDRNSQGFGLYDVQANHLVKGMSTKKQAWKTIKTVMRHELIIHLRIATSGNIDADSCHPFRLKDGAILAHNGVIDGLSDPKADLSDTQRLAVLLDRIASDAIRLEVLRSHSGDQKFAYVSRHRKVHLIGQWSERAGCRVSNTYSFVQPVKWQGYGYSSPASYPDWKNRKPVITDRCQSIREWYEQEERQNQAERKEAIADRMKMPASPFSLE